MSYREELLEIISNNALAPKGILKRTVILYNNQGMRMRLSIIREQTVRLETSLDIGKAIVSLHLYEFGTNTTVEEFWLDYNLSSFRVVIDKKHTSSNTVSVLLCETIEDDDGFYEIFPEAIDVIKELAPSLIQSALVALDDFMRKHSDTLTIKDFGYTNF